jgi:hypothetical protein
LQQQFDLAGLAEPSSTVVLWAQQLLAALALAQQLLGAASAALWALQQQPAPEAIPFEQQLGKLPKTGAVQRASNSQAITSRFASVLAMEINDQDGYTTENGRIFGQWERQSQASLSAKARIRKIPPLGLVSWLFPPCE